MKTRPIPRDELAVLIDASRSVHEHTVSRARLDRRDSDLLPVIEVEDDDSVSPLLVLLVLGVMIGLFVAVTRVG